MSNLAWTVGEVAVTRVVEHEVALPLPGLLHEATPSALARTPSVRLEPSPGHTTLVLGTHYAPPCAGQLVRGEAAVELRAPA